MLWLFRIKDKRISFIDGKEIMIHMKWDIKDQWSFSSAMILKWRFLLHRQEIF